MKEMFNRLNAEINNSVNQFVNGGYRQIYQLIFGTPQFPFWFTIQSLYSCYVVRSSTNNKKRSILLWIKQLLIAALMTFLPREIFAYISHKKSPTTSNPLILAIFGGVFVAMTLSPFDIFYKLTRLLYYFLGILQGINQTRLYTLILRTTQILGNRSLVIALTFATMDQVLEIITRPLLGGQETRMSNITTVIRNLIFSSVYYASTHKTPFTKYIGYHRHYIPALILAFITGTSNATAAFNLRTPVTQQTHPTQHVEEDKNEEEEEKEKKPKVEIVDE